MRLNVAGGSSVARVAGWILTVAAGSAVLGSGAALLFVGASPSSSSAEGSDARTVSIATLGVGAVLTVVGVTMIARNGTDVTTDRGQSLARSAPKPGLRLGPTGISF